MYHSFGMTFSTGKNVDTASSCIFPLTLEVNINIVVLPVLFCYLLSFIYFVRPLYHMHPLT